MYPRILLELVVDLLRSAEHNLETIYIYESLKMAIHLRNIYEGMSLCVFVGTYK
jgi:hypothetical protein